MNTLSKYQEELEEQARRAFGFGHFIFNQEVPSAKGSVWEAKRTPLKNVRLTTEFSPDTDSRPFIRLTRTDFGRLVAIAANPDSYSAIRAIEKQAHDAYENNQNEIRKLRLLLYRFSKKEFLSNSEKNLKRMIRLRLKKAILKSKELKLHPPFLQLPPLYCDRDNRIEIAASSSLRSYLVRNCEEKNKKLTPAEAQQIIVQLLSIVEYLHTELHIAHVDIKPENLLFSRRKDRRIQITLTDLEDSVSINLSGRWTHFFGRPAHGTKEFSPPEYLKAILVDPNSSSITFKTVEKMIGGINTLDYRKIDSFGVGKTIEDILKQTEGGDSESAKKLVSQLTDPDPDKRLSISAAKQSEFFGATPSLRRRLFADEEKSATTEFSVNDWLLASVPKPGDTFYILPEPLQEVIFLKDKFQNQLGTIKVYAESENSDYTTIPETITVIFNTKQALSAAVDRAEKAGYGKEFTLPDWENTKLLKLIIQSLMLNKRSLQNFLRLDCDSASVSTRILRFTLSYFYSHPPASSSKHTRHDELLALFLAARAAEIHGEDVSPILQKWQKEWCTGAFCGFFYSSGECGKFVTNLISDKKEEATHPTISIKRKEGTISCAAEKKQAYDAPACNQLLPKAQSSR